MYIWKLLMFELRSCFTHWQLIVSGLKIILGQWSGILTSQTRFCLVIHRQEIWLQDLVMAIFWLLIGIHKASSEFISAKSLNILWFNCFFFFWFTELMCIIFFPVIHLKVMHLTSQNEWPTKSLSVQMVTLVRHCSLTTENNSCEDSNMKLLII